MSQKKMTGIDRESRIGLLKKEHGELVRQVGKALRTEDKEEKNAILRHILRMDEGWNEEGKGNG